MKKILIAFAFASMAASAFAQAPGRRRTADVRRARCRQARLAVAGRDREVLCRKACRAEWRAERRRHPRPLGTRNKNNERFPMPSSMRGPAGRRRTASRRPSSALSPETGRSSSRLADPVRGPRVGLRLAFAQAQAAPSRSTLTPQTIQADHKTCDRKCAPRAICTAPNSVPNVNATAHACHARRRAIG